RHGAETLGGVAVGAAVWSVVILVLVGVLMAVPPSVSQLDGAGRHERIGPLFRQAVWLALALGVLLFAMVSLTGPLLAGMGIAEEVRPHAAAFLGAIRRGAPPLALVVGARDPSQA